MGDPDVKDHEDYKWLVARERGEDIGHVLAADRAPYEKLGELIGSGMKPSAGFRQRVLDAIDAAEQAGQNGHAAPEPAAIPAHDPIAMADALRAEAPVETLVSAPAEPAAAPVPSAPSLADGPRPPAPIEAQVVPLPGPKKTSPPPPPLRWVWVAGGVAAAAAVVVYIATRSPSGAKPSGGIIASSEVELSSKVEHGDVVRGGSAKIGDTLVFQAKVKGPAELRIYGGPVGETPLARCGEGVPAEAGCTIQRDGEARQLVFKLKLEKPGTVSAVLFPGEHIPKPTTLLSGDLDAAAKAKVLPKQDPSWEVR
jgi:hypothetical protein